MLLTLTAFLPAALYVTWTTEGCPGILRLLPRSPAGGSASAGGWSFLTLLPLLTVSPDCS